MLDDLGKANDDLANLDPSMEVEREQARRARRAKRFLEEHGIEDVGVVYHVWLEAESDWPGDTVLYRKVDGKPMTAVVKDDQVVTIRGWDSP